MLRTIANPAESDYDGRMIRPLSAAVLLLAACSSSSSSGSISSSGGNTACPNVSGTWTVATHCDASLVGQTFTVTQNDCALTFGAPFNGFSGTLTTDGKITVTGPQSCTGTASATAITMSCTPGTCTVTLAR